MTYRDDVDTLYQRSIILQKELDRAEQRLAEREQELANLRGEPVWREDTSPGLRELRTLPPAEELLSRLVDTFAKPTRPAPVPAFDVSELPAIPPPPPPMPAWPTHTARPAVLQTTRTRLDQLDDEALLIIGAIVEELVLEPDRRPAILGFLRSVTTRTAPWR